MEIPTDKHAENLRAALLRLNASGPQGFEGLLAVVLAQLTGQPFRLADSGSQRGRDGDSAFDAGATYFEGKRYDGKLPKDEILLKIQYLQNDDGGQVDLFVVGTTTEVSTQVENEARKACERIGIGFRLLDWSDTDIGSLVIGVASAGERAKEFLAAHLTEPDDQHLVAPAFDAIDHFGRHASFPTRLAVLRAELAREDLGLGDAKARNLKWLTGILKSRRKARLQFAQPLAPLDPEGMPAQPRAASLSLRSAFSGKPEEHVYAVIGNEGVGKSWLVAQTWLEHDPRPLLLFTTADEVLPILEGHDFDEWLVRQLIRQTDGREDDRTKNRWRRRIAMWRENPDPDNVRVSLVIDGLNQTREAPWARYIDGLAVAMKELGGSLVFTTRSAHFAQIRNVISVKVERVLVTNWTPDELSNLLRIRDIDPGLLSAEVFETLRNPRIFGIAVELFESEEIEQVVELNVERLMFEHMRRAESSGAAALTGPQFAGLMQELAKQVLERVTAQQSDDRNLFDVRRVENLRAAATSQFFSPIHTSPGSYEIGPQGLTLGLALWLISALERERRAHRDPSQQLSVILEPLSALDEISNVVLAAAQAACLDENVISEVAAALLEHLVKLQNLPETREGAFRALVRKCPEAFLLAAERVYTSDTHIPNADWLLHALLEHRDDENVWAAISVKVRRWLSFYSLAPERMMFKRRGRDPDDEVDEEKHRRTASLSKKVAELTDSERAYIARNLEEAKNPHFNPLQQVAFYLLAGMPLEDFAPYLVRWSFADALGPAIHSHDKEFRQLVRFNYVDWRETRFALLECLKAFQGEKQSTVGGWAIVEILRATGAPDDASQADKLAEWLSRDQEKYPGFSRIVTYCETDPCDPSSPKPGNVDETAEQYVALEVSKLAAQSSRTMDDHFFSSARTGVARFRPDAAISLHRRLAEVVLSRSGFARRQGVLALVPHSSAILPETAKEFLGAAQASVVSRGENGDVRDEWLTSEYSLLIALPHLSVKQQLDAIQQMETDTLLLDVLDAVLPASPEDVEAAMERAADADDVDLHIRTLAAIHYSGPKLTPRGLALVASFVTAESDIVRFQALAICAASADSLALQTVVDSGWDARALKPDKKTFEGWYGSSAILAAAQLGLLPLPEALDRMDLGHYGFAAVAMGEKAASEVAGRVAAALDRALMVGPLADLPGMETSVPTGDDNNPPLVSLEEPPVAAPANATAALDRLNESLNQFDERQERMGRAFSRFVQDLTAAEAELILEDLTLEGSFGVFNAAPDFRDHAVSLLMRASDLQLRHLSHFAAQVALSGILAGIPAAETLLRRVMDITPIIRRVVGVTKAPALSIYLWRFANDPTCKALCLQRILSAESDRQIATEVIAALSERKGELLVELIADLLQTEEPAHICRAVTIAGFATDDASFWGVLDRFATDSGYVGVAVLAAQAAHERNRWSRHWYKIMLASSDPIEFWKASVQFLKIVDGRFDLWCDDGERSDVFLRFWPTVSREVERRIEKWAKKRNDKLFGDAQPARVFLRVTARKRNSMLH